MNLWLAWPGPAATAGAARRLRRKRWQPPAPLGAATAQRVDIMRRRRDSRYQGPQTQLTECERIQRWQRSRSC